jgi:hypothetical protein
MCPGSRAPPSKRGRCPAPGHIMWQGTEHRFCSAEQNRCSVAAALRRRLASRFPNSEGRFRILTENRLAVSFTRVAKHHAKDPIPSWPAGPFANRGSQTEVHLHFLTGPSFHAPDSLRLGRLKLANKTLYRFPKAVLLHQILIDASGTQARIDLGGNICSAVWDNC